MPLVVALNMIDEVDDDPPSPAAIERLFGVPVVPTSARQGVGLTEIKAASASRVCGTRRCGHVRARVSARRSSATSGR